MIKLEYKRRTIQAEHWEQLRQNEFIELFRRINAPWFSTEGRLELSKWLFENQCSTRFLIRKLKHDKLKLYGPKEGFRNMTMGEFLFADTYYFLYLRDNNPEDLDKLVAVLFKEKRSEFDETLVSTRAKLFENVVFEIKQAIHFNYGAVRKQITKRFPYLFPEAEPKTDKQEHKKPKQIIIPEWDKWMWQLAEGNSDYDFNKISNSRALNVLNRIDSLIKESKKRKK